MKKGKGRRKAKVRSAKSNQFELLRHPLSGVDPAALREALIGVGERAEIEYPDLVQTLFAQLRRWSPAHLLAILASWGLVAGVSDTGASTKSIMSNVEQHHVELLQALAMMIPPEEWGSSPANPFDVREVIDTLGKLTDAFLHRRYLATRTEQEIGERTVLLLQERIRGHTQVVRNWGYFSDVVLISGELYGALDNEFAAFHGFSATDLIETARDLTSIVEKRNSERFRLLKTIFRARSVRQFVRLRAERRLIERAMQTSCSL